MKKKRYSSSVICVAIFNEENKTYGGVWSNTIRSSHKTLNNSTNEPCQKSLTLSKMEVKCSEWLNEVECANYFVKCFFEYFVGWYHSSFKANNMWEIELQQCQSNYIIINFCLAETIHSTLKLQYKIYDESFIVKINDWTIIILINNRMIQILKLLLTFNNWKVKYHSQYNIMDKSSICAFFEFKILSIIILRRCSSHISSVMKSH